MIIPRAGQWSGRDRSQSGPPPFRCIALLDACWSEGQAAELRSTAGAGVLLYTGGLTEARRAGEQFGLDSVSAALAGLDQPSPAEAVGVLHSRVAEFADRDLTDDLCLLAARLN